MGAKVGNKNGRRSTQWRDALERALDRHVIVGCRDYSALNTIADGVVTRALAGSHDDVMEIANRLDGKSHVSVAVQVDDKRPRTRAELIVAANALGMNEHEIFNEPSDSPTAH